MKKTLRKVQLLLLLAVAVAFGACQHPHSPDNIQGKEILKQFNDYLKDNVMDRSFLTLAVGTYEYNNENMRLQLRQMEAAGLITYDVERYAWWEKSKYSAREPHQVYRSFWGYSYYDTEYRYVSRDQYDFQDHYIVTVALTSKGQRLVVDELPTPVVKEDEDMRAPDVDPSKYPWNNADLTEQWAEVLNPFIEHSSEDVKEATATTEADKTTENSTTEADKKDVVRIDAERYKKYTELTLNSETLNIEAFRLKGIKARNIQIIDLAGITIARAEVVAATYDVNDMTRIVYGMENDQRVLYKVELQYYYDKGWELQSVEEVPMAIDTAEL